MWQLDTALSDIRNSRFVYKFRPLKQHRIFSKVRPVEIAVGRKLDAKTKKAVDDYAVGTLGGIRFAASLYIYSLVHGSFKEGWLTESYFTTRMIVPRGARLEGLSKIKSFSRIVLGDDALPDIAYHIDGRFYDKSYRLISLASLIDLCAPYGHVFAKADHSANGQQIYRLATARLTAAEFGKIGNCVIQYPIEQHEFFSEMLPDAVATLRVTTGRTLDGNISPLAAYLRLGRAGAHWISREHAFRIAVIDGTGRLDSVGYTPDWRSWACHPDTRYVFGGQQIPSFAEITDFCVRLHRALPHFLLIGWDITIDDTGAIKLIEWNADHCSLVFTEAVSGPCFEQVRWPVSRQEHERRCRHVL
jgi:hypothetical protein